MTKIRMTKHYAQEEANSRLARMREAIDALTDEHDAGRDIESALVNEAIDAWVELDQWCSGLCVRPNGWRR